MLRILFLFAVLAAALAEDAEAQKHGAKLLEHTFGSVSAVPSGTAVSDLKLVTGDAGMGNALLQGMGYSENSCKAGTAFFVQLIAGGQCQKIGTSADSVIKSQLIGCTPAQEGSTTFTINLVQFASDNCSGSPYQVVAQLKDETSCDDVNDVSSPYAESMAMKCITPDPDSGKHFSKGGLLTAFYQPTDTDCSSHPELIQGVVAGACIKGSTTDENGVKVATNTSTSFTCINDTKYMVNVYAEPACAGDAQEVPQTVAMASCAAGATSQGALAYEKMVCKKASN
jgi:hypothetical protein